MDGTNNIIKDFCEDLRSFALQFDIRIYMFYQNFTSIHFCVFKSCSCFPVKSPDVPLQSLDDLSKSEKYFPIVKYGTIHHSLLEVSY